MKPQNATVTGKGMQLNLKMVKKEKIKTHSC
jgi:hypothetical protein